MEETPGVVGSAETGSPSRGTLASLREASATSTYKYLAAVTHWINKSVFFPVKDVRVQVEVSGPAPVELLSLAGCKACWKRLEESELLSCLTAVSWRDIFFLTQFTPVVARVECRDSWVVKLEMGEGESIREKAIVMVVKLF